MKISLKQLMQPRYYIPAFLKIRDKKAQIVPLNPKPPQEKLLQIVEECKRNHKPIRVIILKARQLGFSTYVEGLIFNDEVSNPLKNGLIIAHEDTASQNLYNMYKTFYENLPPELTPMTKYANGQQMVFENPTQDINEKRINPGLQSKIKVASARNVNTGRSDNFNNLHCSEVAFWQDAKTLMTGLMQCVPDEPNTMVFLESTANGVGGWFYDFWNAAVNGENDFIPLFFAWFEEPTYIRQFDTEEEKQEYIEEVNRILLDENGKPIHTEEYELMKDHNLTYEQLNWRKYTIRNKCHGDVEMFHQEYPSTPDEAFVASGRPRFDIKVLKQYMKHTSKGEIGNLEYNSSGEVIFTPNEKGYVEIWKKPEKDKFYCIGADVAEGLENGDFSSAHVGDSESLDVVATWHGHIDPDLYGKELVKLAKYYNEAYLGVEVNNHGLTTLKSVQREDYFNIYYSKIYDKITDTITQKIGWNTNPKTKPLMIDKLAEFIREALVGIKDKETIRELLTYVIDEKGGTNAQNGCHDDRVMSLAIMLQILLEGNFDSFKAFNPYKEAKKDSYDMDRPDSKQYDEDKDDIDFEDRPEIAD